MKILLVLIAVVMVLSCSVSNGKYIYMSAFEEAPTNCVQTHSGLMLVNGRPSIEYLCIGD
ncbi:hypothetical protein [Escherichia phage vB_EcoM_JNE01]|nr:hypothetical protein [Escherichia phage vB_EcoM_JNE01]